MREKLRKLGLGSCLSFTGRIRYFKEMGGKLCVVLENVKYKGRTVTDHVWFRGGGLKFKRAGAGMRDIVSFKATIQMYARVIAKDPIQFEVDYGLKNQKKSLF